MKLAVVFWSGGGNTESMADAVADGARQAGAEVSLMRCDDFDAERTDDFDALCFGCPASGAEALEESDFEPLFSSIEGKLANQRVALFGSYGWGDGEWMRSWEERCASNGMVLAAESVICMGAPDDGILEQCRALGAKLVK